ncbi:MAG: isopenicillin N synthase family dioxygenase [Alphaproteobacteria bacterium]
MDAIPIIDLGRAQGDRASRQAVADAIAAACTDTGFFTIANHGVSTAVIAALWQSAGTFFDLPQSEKATAIAPYVGYPYGYAPFAKEALSLSLGQAAPPDLKESFSMGPLFHPDPLPDDPDAAFAYAPTIWPESLPNMPAIWADYYRAMETLAARIMGLFALGLGLEEGFFVPYIDRHVSAIRANHYPHQTQPPQPGQLRAGAHTDYGSLTILRQDAAPGGLQVRTGDGIWLDVPHSPDSLIVNIGDLMAQWTNDRWRSTLHRVVNPPADATAKANGSTRRLSVAFFHTPNWDAAISAIPSCVPLGAAPKYPTVLAGPHLMQKYRKSQAIEGHRIEDPLD